MLSIYNEYLHFYAGRDMYRDEPFIIAIGISPRKPKNEGEMYSFKFRLDFGIRNPIGICWQRRGHSAIMRRFNARRIIIKVPRRIEIRTRSPFYGYLQSYPYGFNGGYVRVINCLA